MVIMMDEDLFDKELEMFRDFFRKVETENNIGNKVSDMIHDLRFCTECR